MALLRRAAPSRVPVLSPLCPWQVQVSVPTSDGKTKAKGREDVCAVWTTHASFSSHPDIRILRASFGV